MVEINDSEYWQKYYLCQKMPFRPTLFAQYCYDNRYVKTKSRLIELGCGNGRDAVFFAGKDVFVTAIDQSSSEINFLNNKFRNFNLIFKCCDFTNIDDFSKYDCIYSRFSLHAISDEQENRLINSILNTSKKGTMILFEFRGLNNEYYGLGIRRTSGGHTFFYEGHNRRFVDVKSLASKFDDQNFQLILADEKKGRAPYQNTDFTFGRIIARKSDNTL